MKIFVFLCLLASSTAASDVDPLIVRGTLAPLFSHPYQASLQVATIDGWQHSCGGVIHTTTKILTAAHCLQGKVSSEMQIVVGALNLYNVPNQYTQAVGISSFVYHENFGRASRITNDIGIIYLKRPLNLNNNVQPAALAPKDSNFDNTKCVISGWGFTHGSADEASPDLREVNITSISTTECQLRFLVRLSITFITRKDICVYEASAPSGSRPSACYGDSGGPLMCGPNLNLLAGLTSWGTAGCSGEFPVVYTRVSEYLDWIASK